MKLYYRSGIKYQTAEPFAIHTEIRGYEGSNQFVRITRDGLLTIAANYGWDGGSGPTKDTPSTMIPSLVHDALYQLIRIGVLPRTNGKMQAQADALLRSLMDSETPQAPGKLGWIKERWNDFRGRYWWRGVQLFGDASTLPTAERPVLVVGRD